MDPAQQGKIRREPPELLSYQLGILAEEEQKNAEILQAEQDILEERKLKRKKMS